MKYIQENLKEFEISNILTWHNLGYTGKNINIANLEATNISLPFFHGKIKDPFNIGYLELRNYHHGTATTDVIHQVAPDSEIYILPEGGTFSSKEVSGAFVERALPYIRKGNIHLINASKHGVNNIILNSLIEEIKSSVPATFVTSAGNVGEDGLTGYAKSNRWIAVGAAHLAEEGRILLADYSSRGKELDVMQFSRMYVHDEDTLGRTYPKEGTSFSSPMLVGMLALVQQFFLEKTGRTLYQDEIELFIQDHVIDLGAAGWDEKFGHGLFVLPHPNEIDINKYLSRGQLPDSYPIDSGDIMKFSDIKKDRWSSEEIDLVSNLGIMQGLPDGTFAPAKAVTREELATVIARLIKEGYIKK